MHRVRSITRWSAVTALVLVAGSPASAQIFGAGNGRPFHVIALSTGMSTMSVSPLNSRLTSAQFAPLSNDAASYGASGHYAVGRALLGAELFRSTFGEEGLNNGRTDELSTSQGMVTAAYAILSTARVSVFPQLGVGLGRVSLSLRDRSGTGTSAAQPTFDEIAQSPGSESRLSGRHLLYSFGGGLDYLVTRRGGAAGVVMGVRAGVLAAPNRTTWTRNGQAIVAAPDGAAGGPYLRVVVGLGGR